jgi:peptidoglycan hydrolase CwlO-like protein
MQVTEMKTRLEERIKSLEKEKGLLLEEVRQLKEVVELSEKAKGLEIEVNRLKKEVEMLKEKVPRELLQELGEFVSPILKEEDEECTSCEDEELL